MKSFDVIIVSTSTKSEESYWQNRLMQMRKSIASPDTVILVVHEDWEGGAGNGLGTLYAYKKAKLKAKELFDIDLFKLQSENASLAIYHAANLEYLTELKLPGLIGTPPKLLTILEAAIIQTSIFAPSRKGRLSVFWGNQLFLPIKNVPYTPKYHIDVIARIECETEQSTHDGAFSLSTAMTFALLREFEVELANKNCKLDANNHFWLPALLTWKEYKQYGNRDHYNKMQNFKTKFCRLHSDHSFIGTVPIGKNALYWNYKSLEDYFKHLQKLTESTQEADLMRLFLSISSNNNHPHLIQDKRSILINCDIASGRVENSIILNVTANHIETKNCVIIDHKLDTLKAENSLICNIQDKATLKFSSAPIHTNAFINN